MSIDSGISRHKGESTEEREVRKVLNIICKKVERRVREEKLQDSRVPEYLRFAGLSLVDPRGKSIIPIPVVLEAPPEDYRPGSSKSKRGGDEEEEEVETKDPAFLTIFDENPHELLIKMWNVEAGGEQGDFLGYALIPNSFMTHPAKGARSFMLKADSQFVRIGREKLQITGSIFIKLTPTKTVDARINKPPPEKQVINPYKMLDLKRASTRTGLSCKEINPDIDEKEFDEVENFMLPCSWRLQIFRATRIASVDRITKSSPMIEVCWKGAVTKRGQKSYEKNFIVIGKTSTKQNTLDPNWKDDPSAVYELPPVWTDAPMPGRGDCDTVLKGGGWVAKNNIPDADVGDDKLRQFKGSYLTSAQQKESGAQTSASKWLSDDLGLADSNKGDYDDDDDNDGAPAGLRGRKGIVANPPVVKLAPKELLKSAVVKVKLATILGQHTIENLEVCFHKRNCAWYPDDSDPIAIVIYGNIQEKVELRLNAWVALSRAEERERQCMSRSVSVFIIQICCLTFDMICVRSEERVTRIMIQGENNVKEKPFLEEQV
jgi:hypothetical protein